MSIFMLSLHNIYRLIPSGSGGGGPAFVDPYVAPKWNRPVDWITMPEILTTEDKVAALVSVKDGLNLVSVKVTGDFTVNWGDGSTQSFESGDTAWHVYDYTASLPTCTRGYKQAMLTVTPQAGSSITSLSFVEPSGYPNYYLFTGLEAGILDLVVCCPSLTELKITKSASTYNKVNLGMLERAVILNSQLASVSSMFKSLSNLRFASVQNASTILDWSSAFENCINLVELGPMDTGSGTRFSGMFQGCLRLDDVPSMDFSSALSISNMFYECEGLRKFPPMNLPVAEYAGGVFAGCISLREVGEINMPVCLAAWSMFKGCVLLEAPPTIYAPLNQNFRGMFENCKSIEVGADYNLSSAMYVSNMYSGAVKLRSVPPMTIPSGCSYTEIFKGCTSLEEVVLNVTVTSHDVMVGMFQDCSLLRKISGITFNIPDLDPEISTAGHSSWPYYPGMKIVKNTWSLRRLESTGLNQNTVFVAIPLSKASVAHLCSTLSTVTSGTKTLSFSYPPNRDRLPTYPFPDLVQADVQAALNKGWVVRINDDTFTP